MAASFWSFCWRAPFAVNNVLIGAFFEMLFLGTALIHFIRYRKLHSSLRDMEADCFPTIRVGVIVIFLFAVLHKTNWAFLDPNISCAVMHYRMLQYLVPILPSPNAPGMGTFTIWLTWGTEISIPILLGLGWMKFPTRKLVTVGVIIALGFHFVMSLNGYHNFSALAMAYYVPFLPKGFYRTASAVVAWLLRGRFAMVVKGVIYFSTFCMVIFAFELFCMAVFKNTFPMTRARGQTFLREQGWALFNIAAPLVSLAFAWLSFHRRGRPAVLPGVCPPLWTYGLLLMVGVSSIAPYLGLKTENSFAMFSNLLTEGDIKHWNHVFLPPSMRIFHFQDRLVLIKKINVTGRESIVDVSEVDNGIGSNLPGLRMLKAHPELRLVEFEFRRNVAAACRTYKSPIEIDYEIDGVDYHVPDVHQVPELVNGNGYWLEKLMFFRKVPNSPYGFCLH